MQLRRAQTLFFLRSCDCSAVTCGIISGDHAELHNGAPFLHRSHAAVTGPGGDAGVLPRQVDLPPHCKHTRTTWLACKHAPRYNFLLLAECESLYSCLPQAIEGFALMVKKTAQMLQSFGTELAETELPSEVQATTVLLSTHTDKKEQMKVRSLSHRAHSRPPV